MLIKELVMNGNIKFVIFGSDQEGHYTSATLFIKNNKALLMDTLLKKEDTNDIIEYIEKENLDLETIFISHFEPEYYFGMEQLKAYKPNAKVVAIKKVSMMIAKTAGRRLQYWEGKIECPVNVVLPKALVGTTHDWNGESIQIVGKNKSRTILFFDEYRLVVGGPNLFQDIHPFLGDVLTKDDRLSWVNCLLRIKSLEAKYAIAGHFDGDPDLNGSAIDMTLKYLFQSERLIESSYDSEELYNSLVHHYPHYKGLDLLKLSCKIMKNEEKWD